MKRWRLCSAYMQVMISHKCRERKEQAWLDELNYTILVNQLGHGEVFNS